jgi:hypothetical protein
MRDSRKRITFEVKRVAVGEETIERVEAVNHLDALIQVAPGDHRYTMTATDSETFYYREDIPATENQDAPYATARIRPVYEPAPVAEQSTGSERIRIRIAHTKTVKEGWKYETTVEVEAEGIFPMDLLHDHLEDADRIARQEADRRNAEDEIRRPDSNVE